MSKKTSLLILCVIAILASPFKVKATIEGMIAKDVSLADTVYYLNIIRNSSWYEGIGEPIQADNLPTDSRYYRMTQKTPGGKYLHVESLHNGNPIYSEAFVPFILGSRFGKEDEYFDYDKNYYSVDPNWIAECNFVTETFLTPSVDGVDAVLEKAYNRNGDLMYFAVITKPESGNYIFSYIDNSGQLVNLADWERYRFGTCAHLMWNDETKELEVYALDSFGNVIPSKKPSYYFNHSYNLPPVEAQHVAQADDKAVYATGYIARNGWYFPQNIVDSTKVGQAPVMRFSKPNSSGQYQVVDFLSNGLKPSSENLPQFKAEGFLADSLETDFLQMIKNNATRIEMVGDPYDNTVIRRNYYNSDNNPVGFIYYLSNNGGEGYRELPYHFNGFPYALVNTPTSHTFGLVPEVERDANGFDASILYLDNNQYVQGENGEYGIKRNIHLNDDGSLDMYSYSFDENYKPVKLPGDYYGNRVMRDSRGNDYAIIFLDAEGNITLTNEELDYSMWQGAAVVNQYYNEMGQVTRIEFYDPDFKPICNQYGAHVLENIYNPDYTLDSQRAYDLVGKPVLLAPGVASFINKYDDKGRRTEVHKYDLEGKPANYEGWSSIFFEYDPNTGEQTYKLYMWDSEKGVEVPVPQETQEPEAQKQETQEQV